MSESLQNDRFLRACRREPVDRTPVWAMRQAGRYLPEYRAIREKSDFLTMCRTPDLAAEVTLQPVERFGLDAAILFSDIMVVPEAMGMRLELVESRGPVLDDPVRGERDLERLRRPDVHAALGYVFEAIRRIRRELAGRVPLIGFSGSPWTLATYMVEGEGSKQFRHARAMVYAEPALAHRLLERVTDVVADYLLGQVEAGVDAVQVFDTWGGILPPAEYREFSLAYMARIVERLRPAGVPVILFSKDCSHSLEAIADAGADVVGIDWRTDIGQARRRVGARAAVQGNLDPVALFAPPTEIRRRVVEVLEAVGPGEGHVFNLGHGILPDTPPDHLRAMVDAVHEESPRFHGVQS